MALLTNRDHEERPWGSFDRFTLNELSTVKVISVKADQRLSLQSHEKRNEFWHILSGDGVVTIGETEHPAKALDEFEIPAGVPHRIKAGSNGIWFLEIALGTFDEHDEVRIEDDFGRRSPGT